MKKLLISLSILLLLATPAFAERIVCASTTSTQNSGLFDYILPIFNAKTGIEVHVIAVGTGAALEMGKRGDADVVFVHAKEMELQGVKEGYFVNRHDVMYNDFVVVGPRGSAGEFGGLKRGYPSGALRASTPRETTGTSRSGRGCPRPFAWPTRNRPIRSPTGGPGFP
jgi:tungstate transport system substrate-binding protein